MKRQEQAFRAYYSSMTDAELLQTAANRSSFIEVAQRLLAEEVTKRKLGSPPAPLAPVRQSAWWGWWRHIVRLVHRRHHPAPA